MFIRNLIDYIRLVKIIREADKNEKLKLNFSKLYNSNFKEDWVGRWYTVLNPHVQDMKSQINGVTSQILEYTDEGLSDKAGIEKWCMEKIFLASNFIKNKELLDVMTYSLERLDDDENYLFILKPILFDDLMKSFKRLMWILLSLGIAAAAYFILF